MVFHPALIEVLAERWTTGAAEGGDYAAVIDGSPAVAIDFERHHSLKTEEEMLCDTVAMELRRGSRQQSFHLHMISIFLKIRANAFE
uniref:PKS_DH domain-containing protein n=1 Tax=Angiostrongylus cantonensis TaxID=6313 RepID=A0A0K0CU97_ANGCA